MKLLQSVLAVGCVSVLMTVGCSSVPADENAEPSGESAGEASGDPAIEEGTADETTESSSQAIAYSTGWHHVCWSEAGLYRYQVPPPEACLSLWKRFGQGHRVYVDGFITMCGYTWAKVRDSYGNSGRIKRAALCPGW